VSDANVRLEREARVWERLRKDEREPMMIPPGVAYMVRSDPKHLLFTLSRYKFAAKALSGKQRILEVGCQDGFGTTILSQTGSQIVGIDLMPKHIENAKTYVGGCSAKVKFYVADALDHTWDLGEFDGAVCLDVLEHVDKEDEDQFLNSICARLTPQAVLVIGTPSLESQRYASEGSEIGHVNCKTGLALQELAAKHLHNTFLFGMNDEVVHTGFHSMSHYLLLIAVSPILAP
jgi:2-polyprenyl-3-methyl-5-hydroxy-6-metoxy-1,4-benzoquinol methylase